MRHCKLCNAVIDEKAHNSRLYCGDACSYESKKKRMRSQFIEDKKNLQKFKEINRFETLPKTYRLIEFFKITNYRLTEFIMYTVCGIEFYRNYDRFYWNQK